MRAIIKQHRYQQQQQQLRLIYSSARDGSLKQRIAWSSGELLDKARLNNLISRLSEQEGPLDWAAYVHLLKACGRTKCLQQGRRVVQHMITSGLGSNEFLANHTLNMFIRCGSMEEARLVFLSISNRDLVLWTAMISGYAQNGQNKDAFNSFWQMQLEGFRPDKITLVSILNACTSLRTCDLIRSRVSEGGWDSDSIVSTALVNAYGKSDLVDRAQEVFEEISERNYVTWTTMISIYARRGNSIQAFGYLKRMLQEGREPDVVTFVTVLGACSTLEQGVRVHGVIDKSHIAGDVVVKTAVVNMYGKMGELKLARVVFDEIDNKDVVAWNAMITVYSQHGESNQALSLFSQVNQLGLPSDEFTFISLLSVCASYNLVAEGDRIHQCAVEQGLDSHVDVGNSIISFYGKCGSLDQAREFFEGMRTRTLVTWNAMISNYIHNGLDNEAFKLYQRLQSQPDIKPDSITFTEMLNSCGHVSALRRGQRVHSDLLRSGFESVLPVGNATVYMFGKCGSLAEAQGFFDAMPRRDEISWNTIVAAYAQHGHVLQALKQFHRMHQEGVRSDGITLVSVLYAYSHAGLVREGCKLFGGMEQELGIGIDPEHISCMVDLLARAGKLREAEMLLGRLNLLGKLPPWVAAAAWMTLLGACRTQGNVELGRRVAKKVAEFEPGDSASYVVLSNIFAAAGKWGDVTRVRKMMEERGVKKEAGRSSVEVGDWIHHFGVRDTRHPEMEAIYGELERLNGAMRDLGYVADTQLVLHNVSEERKEEFLAFHSERLAIAYGLISSSKGDKSPLRIIKNLRVCSDCHTATKLICKIVQREIVVRDVNRFHHFNDGQCSCGDYW